MSMQNWADVSNWKIWLNRMFNILLYLKFNQNSRIYSASPLRRVVKKLIFYEISVWFTTNPTFPWLGKCQITVVQLFPTCTFFAEKYFPELEINFAFLHWVGEAPCSLQLKVRKTLRLFSTHIFNGSRLCTTACLGRWENWFDRWQKIILAVKEWLPRRVERQRRQGECEDWGVFSSRIGHLPTIHKRAARA